MFGRTTRPKALTPCSPDLRPCPGTSRHACPPFSHPSPTFHRRASRRFERIRLRHTPRRTRSTFTRPSTCSPSRRRASRPISSTKRCPIRTGRLPLRSRPARRLERRKRSRQAKRQARPRPRRRPLRTVPCTVPCTVACTVEPLAKASRPTAGQRMTRGQRVTRRSVARRWPPPACRLCYGGDPRRPERSSLRRGWPRTWRAGSRRSYSR